MKYFLFCAIYSFFFLVFLLSDFAGIISSTMLSTCSVFFAFNQTLQNFYMQSILAKQPGQVGTPLSTRAFTSGFLLSTSLNDGSSSSSLTVSHTSLVLPALLASLFGGLSAGTSSSGSDTVTLSMTVFTSALASCYPAVPIPDDLSQDSNITDLQLLRLNVDRNGTGLDLLPVMFYVPIRFALFTFSCGLSCFNSQYVPYFLLRSFVSQHH